VKCGEFLD